MHTPTCVLCILLASSLSFTRGATLHPDTVVIRSALIVRSAPGFADDIARCDPIEAALVTGTWRAPAEGTTVRINDTLSSVWERTTADSAGWFEHPILEGGYVKATVALEDDATMILAAMGNSMVYVNGVPRSGNPYGAKDEYESWETRFDYSLLPVRLRKGTNALLFHCTRGRFKARLFASPARAFLNTRDLTTPDVVSGQPLRSPAAIVVVNTSTRSMRGWTLRASLPGMTSPPSTLPLILPLSARKAPFVVDAEGTPEPGPISLRLILADETGAPVDSAVIILRVVSAVEPRKETFFSGIDSSVQYYALSPANSTGVSPALFFSLHGAGVEAINQARAYGPKSWGMIAAPTNRRPFGFNWEDWGRWDALEVLARIKERYPIDESRVYLTGHSMGGHGVYHVGSLFPDQFAAIGPSAGWISFWTYRVREEFTNPSPLRRMIMRATLPSDTYTMAANYGRMGVYILHGGDDDNVPVGQSRMMAKHLEGFHRDYVYHEQKGAGHWWDLSDEPGADCVDWPPMFDFFARHARALPERIRRVMFVTASPGVSASCDWVRIEGQTRQYMLSKVDLQCDPLVRRVSGSTENVSRCAVAIGQWHTTAPWTAILDGDTLRGIVPDTSGRLWLHHGGNHWTKDGPPAAGEKNSARMGAFKDLFRNHVMLVFGTAGTSEENSWAFAKARFDAERFWYQGNGSLDVLADSDFVWGPRMNRNVVLYGNSSTNRAWHRLLGGGPVQVERGRAAAGGHEFRGGDIACLLIRPLPGSPDACVGAVAATGIVGMRLTDRMPYLLPGVAYPDLLIGRASMLSEGEGGLLGAGFFGNDWSVASGEFVWE